jgi:peptidoglycan hydrolase-like protein with peptidoglycan-binding domain
VWVIEIERHLFS